MYHMNVFIDYVLNEMIMPFLKINVNCITMVIERLNNVLCTCPLTL